MIVVDGQIKGIPGHIDPGVTNIFEAAPADLDPVGLIDIDAVDPIGVRFVVTTEHRILKGTLVAARGNFQPPFVGIGNRLPNIGVTGQLDPLVVDKELVDLFRWRDKVGEVGNIAKTSR